MCVYPQQCLVSHRLGYVPHHLVAGLAGAKRFSRADLLACSGSSHPHLVKEDRKGLAIRKVILGIEYALGVIFAVLHEAWYGFLARTF